MIVSLILCVFILGYCSADLPPYLRQDTDDCATFAPNLTTPTSNWVLNIGRSAEWTNTWNVDTWVLVPNYGLCPANYTLIGSMGPPVDAYENILLYDTVIQRQDAYIEGSFKTEATSDNAVGLVLRYGSVQSFYVCFMSEGWNPECEQGPTSGPFLTIAKYTNQPCVPGVSNRLNRTNGQTYASNQNHPMRFTMIGNELSCTYDYNGDGQLTSADPILTYTDPDPLPWQNTKMGIYSFVYNGCMNSVQGITCDPGTSTDNTVGIIAGSVVGGIALVITIIVIVVIILMRRSRRSSHDENTIGVQLNSPINHATHQTKRPSSSPYINSSLSTSSSSPSALMPHLSKRQTALSSQEIEFLEQVGEGGYGIVWKGKWRGMTVAIKQLKKQDLDQKTVDEFVRESELMSNLPPHQNVVKFIGVTADTSPISIVTEFMEGGSVHGFISKNRGKMKFQQKMSILSNCASGMIHLSLCKIVHKDLAARNLLMTASMETKISDFGLSRVSTSAQNNTVVSQAEVGPIKWMAWESLKDKMFSSKSDVYGFAITAIEILTEQDPYPEIPLLDFAMRIFHDRPIAKDYLPANLPKPLSNLLIRCLNDDPKKRPDFEEIKHHLEQISEIQ